MNIKLKSTRIADLMADYFHHLDLAQEHMGYAKNIKTKILKLANPGRYNQYIVGECKAVEINVRAYVRSGFKYIRKGKIQ